MTIYNTSLFETAKSMPEGIGRDNALSIIGGLEGRERWEALRRPDQIPPADSLWSIWILSGGRGAGKTRTGAEEAKEFAENNPGSRLLLVARTAADVREVVVEGESGILSLYESHDPQAPMYKPSIRRLEWPNGSVAFCTSADEPDSLRGTEAHFAWADEIGSWRAAKDDTTLDAWDNLRLSVRLGLNPRIIATTTPKKTKMLKRIHKELKKSPLFIRLTQAGTILNRDNLSDPYLRILFDRYEDTKAAATELRGTWPWKL